MNKEELLVNAHPVFQAAEHFFCFYFTAEITIRFCAFRQKKDCLRDGSFLFDSSLVFIMVLETWVWNMVVVIALGHHRRSNAGSSQFDLNASVLRVARLLRLTRMARMARLLKAVPELVILLKGLAAALRSVFFTLILLFALLYIFAIAFTQLLRGEDVGDKFFGSVGKSIHTLWLYAALLDEITHLMDDVWKTGLANVLLLDVFIICASLLVMNMLVGVLCEVVSAVAKTEKEELALSVVKTKVEHIFYELALDADNNGLISKDEFVKIIENREAARAIQELGVDVVQMVDMAEVFFATDDEDAYDKELSFSEFMDAVIQLRGTNFATVKDLVNVRNFLTKQIAKYGHSEQRKSFVAGRKSLRLGSAESSAGAAAAAAADFAARMGSNRSDRRSSSMGTGTTDTAIYRSVSSKSSATIRESSPRPKKGSKTPSFAEVAEEPGDDKMVPGMAPTSTRQSPEDDAVAIIQRVEQDLEVSDDISC
jgi:hypothetical protein